jgi:hypothetical protein
MLSLQVIEETQTLGRKVLSYDRHPEVAASTVCAILATVLLGKRQAVEASFISKLSGLCQELLPLLARQTTVVPVGSCMFATVIEEAVIVVFVLEGCDLLVNKLVKICKVLLEIVWYGEVHLCHNVAVDRSCIA